MIERKELKLLPDTSRVLLQFFNPGSEKRIRNIINRVIGLSDAQAGILLDKVIDEFSGRHRDFTKEIERNYKRIENYIPEGMNISSKQKLLVGSYFSKEYSIEAAALFNPSIVLHPEERMLDGGTTKFIMSLRSTGEGHISSISFRTGTITNGDEIKLDPAERFAVTGNKEGIPSSDIDTFYEVKFDSFIPIPERVLFPVSKYESNGMEDARFVRFINDDGSVIYYATYTAYDGKNITIQLIETTDFEAFRINMLKGKAVKDKGMALFPRKVNGLYTIVSRQDGENLYIMQSDNIFQWEDMQLLRAPELSWEFVQLGNCGSPIETEEGWLLLTHSVGAMRTYVMSALLLDKDNPSKVIGYLPEPLISPNEKEREGYVPNVIYSCGSMIVNGVLIIPYAMSDWAISFATIKVRELMKGFIRI